MRDLKEIAERKIQADLQRILDKLAADIEATYRRQAAGGSLKSGNTFIMIMTLLTDAYKELCNQSLIHYQWVMKESMIVNQNLLNHCLRQAEFYGGQLQRSSAEHLQKAAKMVGHPNFYDRYLPQVAETDGSTLKEFKANLEGEAAAKINRGIKGLMSRIVGWVSGFVRGA